MNFNWYPDRLTVERGLQSYDPILLMIAFDLSEAILANADDAVEHTVLLKKTGKSELDIDKYFRFVMNQDGQDWTFVYPAEYKNISDKDKRIKTFYNDGVNALDKAAAILHFQVSINIPVRYRRHLNLIRDHVRYDKVKEAFMSREQAILSLFPAEKDVPPDYRLEELHQKTWLSGGKILAWNGPVQTVLSPLGFRTADGFKQKTVGSFPLLSAKEALDALDAAYRAYDNGRGEWPVMPLDGRIKAMRNFALRMKEKRAQVVKLLMWEIGKNKADSEREFDRTVEYIEATIDALKDLDRVSSRFQIEEGVVAQIRRAPLGVVLCMGPFNYPLNETFTTLIPALIMGNTVIFKPAKYGVLLFEPLIEAFQQSFPAGVVNMITGDGKEIITPIMQDGRVNCLAFIGSANVANILERTHPKPNRLKRVLGLNAKNPAIILPDADLDATVKECLLGALSFNGQRCTALKILFVHRSIADAFNQKLCAAVDKLKNGMPWEDGVHITPLPEAGKTAWLKDYITDASQKGAKVINELGGVVNETFFYPAIVYPVKPDMKLYTEEQFGPIVPVVPYDNVQEAVDYITDSTYGQQLSIFGRDPAAIAALVDPLVNQVCRVNINSQCQRGPDVFPFTGRKDSAEGTLSVSDALRVFTIRTLVAAKENEANVALLSDIIKNRRSGFLNTDFIF